MSILVIERKLRRKKSKWQFDRESAHCIGESSMELQRRCDAWEKDPHNTPADYRVIRYVPTAATASEYEEIKQCTVRTPHNPQCMCTSCMVEKAL